MKEIDLNEIKKIKDEEQLLEKEIKDWFFKLENRERQTEIRCEDYCVRNIHISIPFDLINESLFSEEGTKRIYSILKQYHDLRRRKSLLESEILKESELKRAIQQNIKNGGYL
jgi:hypothetical protein